MARVVGVHGIGQQLKGKHTLLATWLPAMRDGLELAGAKPLAERELVCAFYGDLFRPAGINKPAGEPLYRAVDIQEDFELGLLTQWWLAAARTEPEHVPGPEQQTKLRTPQVAQRALNALSRCRFFAGLSERALIGFIKQVHQYMVEPALRSAIRERVTAVVGPDTRVLVGHSLGSVVAYEALCAHPDWPVRALITLGSPLGIRNLIFDRLEPAPVNGKGVWPIAAAEWTNIADQGDVVALVKQLRPLFGEQLDDIQVDNGAKAHNIGPYLTAGEAGHAIARGLAS